MEVIVLSDGRVIGDYEDGTAQPLLDRFLAEMGIGAYVTTKISPKDAAMTEEQLDGHFGYRL